MQRQSGSPELVPESPTLGVMDDREEEPGAAEVAVPRGKRLPLVRCGDAFELLAELHAESVDLICTSPPYWGLRTYGFEQNERILDEWRAERRRALDPPGWEWYRSHGGHLGLEPYPEWYVTHVIEILRRARVALKPGGSLWLNVGDTYFARWSSIRQDGRQGLGSSERARRRTPAGGWRQDKQLLLIPARVAIALQEDGWILRNDLIWSKPSVAPRPESDRLRLSHEHFFHFVRKRTDRRATYYYNRDAAEDGALDVVSCSTRAGRDGHSATFPMTLVVPRILSSSPPGGFVVDPFCGSGTTLVAAVANGRVAQGFELSPSWARRARDRVRQARLAQVQVTPGSQGPSPSSCAKNSSDVSVMKRSSTV